MSFQTKAARGKEDAVMKLPLREASRELRERLVTGIDSLRGDSTNAHQDWFRSEKAIARQEEKEEKHRKATQPINSTAVAGKPTSVEKLFATI